MARTKIIAALLSISLLIGFYPAAQANQFKITPTHIQQFAGTVCMLTGAYCIFKQKPVYGTICGGAGYCILFPESTIKPMAQWINKQNSSLGLLKAKPESFDRKAELFVKKIEVSALNLADKAADIADATTDTLWQWGKQIKNFFK